MNKFINSFLLVCLALGSQTLHAGEKSDNTPGFWEILRAKLEQMAPQKKVTATTAVGGVRGAKMAADDVYWKGEKVAQTIDAEELETFQKAMALVTTGELAKAQDAFAEFVAKNPDSLLRKDADLALTQLQAAK